MAAALLVMATGAQAHQRHPAVEALPEFARLTEPGGTPFSLRGRLRAAEARQMEALARAVQRDVARRFLGRADKSACPPVDLCLFETTVAYRTFVAAVFGPDGPSDLGFYHPDMRLVAANLGLGAGNLRHEMTHALLLDDFPEIPAWVNEGLGALYGTARQSRNGFTCLVNYRVKHLRAARRDGTLPDLTALAASTPAEVYGPRAGAYYSLARHVLLYLDSRGALDRFLRELRGGSVDAGRQGALLERHVDFPAFLRWTDALVVGEEAPRAR